MLIISPKTDFEKHLRDVVVWGNKRPARDHETTGDLYILANGQIEGLAAVNITVGEHPSAILMATRVQGRWVIFVASASALMTKVPQARQWNGKFYREISKFFDYCVAQNLLGLCQ